MRLFGVRSLSAFSQELGSRAQSNVVELICAVVFRPATLARLCHSRLHTCELSVRPPTRCGDCYWRCAQGPGVQLELHRGSCSVVRAGQDLQAMRSRSAVRDSDFFQGIAVLIASCSFTVKSHPQVVPIPVLPYVVLPRRPSAVPRGGALEESYELNPSRRS